MRDNAENYHYFSLFFDFAELNHDSDYFSDILFSLSLSR